MLKFNIRNQQLSRVDSFRPVEKSVNYLTASFSFLTNDWEGFTKKATCKNVTTGKHYDAEIKNDTCLIPWEALTDKGSFEISVRGTNGKTTITTSAITVDLGRTLLAGAESNPPTPTELDLIWKAVGNLDELRTDNKENLVAAVNSLVGKGGNGTNVVKTVNGIAPDENGNVEITIPDSGGNVDLTGVVKSVNGQTPDQNGNVEIDASRPTDEQVQTAVSAYLEEHPVSGGIGSTASALLINILRNAVYTADQSANITALEAALASGGSETPKPPTSDVEQTGTILSIVSGVTVSQTGSVLAIA